jgi:hypothetical protein
MRYLAMWALSLLIVSLLLAVGLVTAAVDWIRDRLTEKPPANEWYRRYGRE